MFDWIIDGVIAILIAWGFWSIVPVVVFIVLSMLAYARITAPVNGVQRQNFKENQKSLSLTIPKARKIIKMLLTMTVLVMGGILFSIGLFKMG